MNVISLFRRMDKDRGYAWVILGASTVLMCIGPSTYTSFGFLISNVPMSSESQLWILNLFYGIWLLTAFVAAFYGQQKPRQLATTGTLMAAIGFLVSSSTVDNSGWLYLTFSVCVGLGLGLSFHTAYLVVMSNFDRYKGLANGVCQLSIAIGQITTPFLYTIVSMSKDRFQIKALTTAIGFLTTLFYVVPTSTHHHRPTYLGDRNRRYSNSSSRRSSRGESLPLQSPFLQTSSNNSISVNQGQVRPRRRSQYLLAVSTSLLPNIPEEPESSTSMNDTLTSASSESELHNSQQQSLASQSCHVLAQDRNNANESSTRSEQMSHRREGSSAEENEANGGGSHHQSKSEPVDDNRQQSADVGTVSKTSIRRKSEGSLPSYVGSFSDASQQLGNGLRKPTKEEENESDNKEDLTRRYSESQLQSSNNILNPMSLERRGSDVSKSQESKQRGSKSCNRGESIIDLSLLQDFHFLNMATFSALCTLTVVNFPIVLYAHVSSLCEECTTEANVALLIISIVDLISRLLISYVSDYPILGRRSAFLLGCGFAGVLIAATSVVEDILLIYCICVAYGICLGMLVTSEYLMFIESFGYERFPQAYSFVNLFKLLIFGILALFVGNPLAIYVYPIHPLDQDVHSRNTSLYCDPLGISGVGSESTSIVRLLMNVAIPSILCTLAWITEDIYKATHRCSTQTKTSSHVINNDVP